MVIPDKECRLKINSERLLTNKQQAAITNPGGGSGAEVENLIFRGATI